MTWLTAILCLITIGALAAVVLLAGARRRLALELATVREQALAARVGPGPSTGLLASSVALSPLSEAPPRVVTVAASATDRAEGVAAELHHALSLARAESVERGAVIASLREEARLVAERALRQEQALSAIVAPGAEGAEALKMAQEEARIARVARDSFAGESRLLREELRRLTARLAEAPGGASEAKSAPLTAEAAGLLAGQSSRWWCSACGRGGTKAEPCCANAR